MVDEGCGKHQEARQQDEYKGFDKCAVYHLRKANIRQVH
jgi:hypothetical protein